jgi:hypothetical protein
MNAVLNAFSLAQEPHMTVKTLVIPFGATAMNAFSTESTQSTLGLTPRAGLLFNNNMINTEA